MTTEQNLTTQEHQLQRKPGSQRPIGLWTKFTAPQFSREEMESLTRALEKVCEFQKGYNKTPEQFADLLEGFIMILAEHKMEEIIEGLGIYVSNYSDIPSPNDILDVIDPQFKPDRGIYDHLLHRRKINGLEDLSAREQKYMALCEQEKMKEAGL